MKRIICFLCVVIIISIKANSQKNNAQLNNFLSSPEYSRISNESVFGFGTIDFKNSNVISGENDSESLINIVYTKQGVFQGVVQAIPLPSKFSNVLPGDEHYLMVLYDYREYDTTTRTGKIKLVDLNYDNFTPLEMVVNNGTVVNLDIQNMPDVISSKYSYLLKKKDLGNPIYKSVSEKSIATTHHCDANGNGNVTFGECFSCLSAACAGNQQCAILCAIVNAGGVWTVGVPACTTSMAASCVWIAIQY